MLLDIVKELQVVLVHIPILESIEILLALVFFSFSFSESSERYGVKNIINK